MHALEGWKHLESAIVPGIYDAGVADEVIHVDTDDAFGYAVAGARYLGLSLSPSAAANLCAALRVAEGIETGTVVTVFPDNFMKYLNDAFWDDPQHAIDDPFR